MNIPLNLLTVLCTYLGTLSQPVDPLTSTRHSIGHVFVTCLKIHLQSS
uniref:Uncharacterized protein n=1 Tax=Anguilla anguilla TaxID=7936 RepID=A0A0E9Q7Q3_ANGAN